MAQRIPKDVAARYPAVVFAAQFHARYGRWPSAAAKDDAERKAGRFIVNRRTRARRDELDQETRDVFDRYLPDWLEDGQELWDRKWNELLGEVVAFTAREHRAPSRLSKNADERRLSDWLVNHRRAAVHDPDYPAWRVEALDERLPGWRDPHGSSWDRSFSKVESFVTENGRVPSKSVTSPPAERAMGFWLATNLSLSKKDTYPAHRKVKLESLSVLPVTNDDLNRNHLAAFEAYVVEHHRLPSAVDADLEVARIGRWLSTRRIALNSGTLPEWIRVELDRIAPRWEEPRRWRTASRTPQA